MKKFLLCISVLVILTGCTVTESRSGDAAFSSETPSSSIAAPSFTPSSNERASSLESSSEEPEEHAPVPETFTPGPEDIVVNDFIYSGPWEDIREWLPKENLENSYSFITSLYVEDIAVWDYEVYLPRFRDEIAYDGAEKIKDFFADIATKEEQAMQSFISRGFEGSSFPLSTLESGYFFRYYTYINYAVEFVDPYLTVTIGSSVYLSGMHGFESLYCHNFDMRTGELLELEDVLTDMKQESAHLTAVLNRQLEEMFDRPPQVDIMDWYSESQDSFNHTFRIGTQGIDILFSTYELGPYSYGMPEVTLPYGEILSNIQLYD